MKVKKSKLSRFSVFFLFKSCRRGRKKQQTLVSDSDNESCKELHFQNSIVKESNIEEFQPKQLLVKSNKSNNLTGVSGSRKGSSRSQNEPNGFPSLETTPKRDKNSKVVKNLNLKFSPRKKRNNSFSPAKDSPLNCHVTVELSQTYPTPSQVTDGKEDKKSLLERPKSVSPPKTDLKVGFKDENKQHEAKLGRSKSFTEKENFLPRKTQALQNLHNLKVLKKKSIQSQNFSKSFGNFDKQGLERNFDHKLNHGDKDIFWKKRSEKTSEKSKSLVDITSKHSENAEKCESVMKKSSETFHVASRDQERRSGNSKPISRSMRNDLSEQTMKLTSTQLRSRPSQTRIQQRPFSMMESSNESNYVMLNPIPPVLKGPVKPHQNQLWNEKYSSSSSQNRFCQASQATLISAKSHENLDTSNVKSYDYSKWATGYQDNFNDSQLYSSPAVDYTAKVDDLLIKLRKSLKTAPEQSLFATRSQHFYGASNSGFPLKKSKSLEPITAAQKQFLLPEEPSSYNNRYAQTSRSRSRIRHIAKKYNMYTSNENLNSLQFNPTWKQKPMNSYAGLGHDDYVYLSQIPNSLSYSNVQPRNEPSFSSTNFQSQSDEPYLMSSSKCNYYHLNLYVQNARSNPDGAESTPHMYGSEVSDQSCFSRRENLSKPQVFYSLDV